MAEKRRALADLIAGGIWAIEHDGTMLVVDQWSFRCCAQKTELHGTHLVGWNVTHREGYTSSKVIAFDRSTGVVVTRSGRRVQLTGNPGASSDAEYVWRRWCSLNEVDDWTDQTRAILTHGLPNDR